MSLIEDRVASKLKSRADVGLKKYSVDMTRTDIEFIGWMRHLQDELLDAAVYAERLIYELESNQLVLEPRDTETYDADQSGC